ncbi:hypothetical protein MMC22_003601 [Lobaria immixta]|nr:hypothetical protein [Lobaria immixta]
MFSFFSSQASASSGDSNVGGDETITRSSTILSDPSENIVDSDTIPPDEQPVMRLAATNQMAANRLHCMTSDANKSRHYPYNFSKKLTLSEDLVSHGAFQPSEIAIKMSYQEQNDCYCAAMIPRALWSLIEELLREYDEVRETRDPEGNKQAEAHRKALHNSIVAARKAAKKTSPVEPLLAEIAFLTNGFANGTNKIRVYMLIHATCLLYPCYRFDHANGFAQVTKVLVYNNIGDLVDHEDYHITKYRNLRVPSHILGEFNV